MPQWSKVFILIHHGMLPCSECHPASLQISTIEAWIPGSALRPRNDESSETSHLKRKPVIAKDNPEISSFRGCAAEPGIQSGGDGDCHRALTLRRGQHTDIIDVFNYRIARRARFCPFTALDSGFRWRGPGMTKMEELRSTSRRSCCNHSPRRARLVRKKVKVSPACREVLDLLEKSGRCEVGGGGE
jgi:hypothetical protein